MDTGAGWTDALLELDAPLPLPLPLPQLSLPEWEADEPERLDGADVKEEDGGSVEVEEAARDRDTLSSSLEGRST